MNPVAISSSSVGTRRADPYSASINSRTQVVKLQTSVELTDGGGNPIEDANVKPNPVALEAKADEWCDPATGAPLPPDMVDGVPTQPAGSISRWQYWYSTITVADLGLDSSATLETILNAASAAQIAAADALGEFD